MKNIAVGVVSTIVRGIVQVLIDETVRAEKAEQQVVLLSQQLQERVKESEMLTQALAGVQTMPTDQNGYLDLVAAREGG